MNEAEDRMELQYSPLGKGYTGHREEGARVHPSGTGGYRTQGGGSYSTPLWDRGIQDTGRRELQYPPPPGEYRTGGSYSSHPLFEQCYTGQGEVQERER
jgi:hypothetical protein